MSDTLQTIQRLERERHEMYKLAGQRQLTPSQMERLQQMTNELYVLWDQHRREDAVRRWGARSMVQSKPETTDTAA